MYKYNHGSRSVTDFLDIQTARGSCFRVGAFLMFQFLHIKFKPFVISTAVYHFQVKIGRLQTQLCSSGNFLFQYSRH